MTPRSCCGRPGASSASRSSARSSSPTRAAPRFASPTSPRSRTRKRKRERPPSSRAARRRRRSPASVRPEHDSRHRGHQGAHSTRLKPQLPKDLTMVTTRDDSTFIYASIASLEEHLLVGSILASLVVLIFIRNLPATIISSLAIPASLIATFTLMRAMDFTLNTMTLARPHARRGHRHRRRDRRAGEHLPEDRRRGRIRRSAAAVEGTGEVLLAVLATSVSLVVIFLPVAFMTGYAQRFIYPFGLTMAFAIMVSLLVSVTLTPMLGARMLRRTPAGGHARHQRFYQWIDHAYTRSLRWSLAHRGAIVVDRAARVRHDVPARPLRRPIVPADRGSGRVRSHGGCARGHVARRHGKAGARVRQAARGTSRAWTSSCRPSSSA